jgi:hypothetical protein
MKYKYDNLEINNINNLLATFHCEYSAPIYYLQLKSNDKSCLCCMTFAPLDIKMPTGHFHIHFYDLKNLDIWKNKNIVPNDLQEKIDKIILDLINNEVLIEKNCNNCDKLDICIKALHCKNLPCYRWKQKIMEE